MTEEFKLPGSSFPEVSKIIQGYATLGKAVSLAEVSKAIGMDPTSISRNAGFLVSVGILEAGKNKAPTSLGVALGNALMHEQDEEVKRLFAEVVADNEFLKGIVSAIRIRKGMDDNALRSHIAYSAGAKKGNPTTTGSGTLIEILQISGAIQSEDGKYVVASSGSAPSVIAKPDITHLQQTQAQNDGRRADVAVAAPTALSLTSGTAGVAININIEVSCEAGDLDTLGQKLRTIIDELNTQINDPSFHDDANTEDTAE